MPRDQDTLLKNKIQIFRMSMNNDEFSLDGIPFRSTHSENKNFNIFAWKKGPTKATNPKVHEHYGVVLLAQLLLRTILLHLLQSLVHANSCLGSVHSKNL